MRRRICPDPWGSMSINNTTLGPKVYYSPYFGLFGALGIDGFRVMPVSFGLEFTALLQNPLTDCSWVAVKELKLSYHNGYI